MTHRGPSDTRAVDSESASRRSAQNSEPSVSFTSDRMTDLESAEQVELTVLMPCLNEAETLGRCIEQAHQTMKEHHICGEIVIADNGSTDGSQEIARGMNSRVIHVEEKGYGSAVMAGIAAARGKNILMGDADGSYDFSHIPRFLDKLTEGFDLVMGNRFKGGIQPGAMPPLHRFLGNPVLSGIGRLFFRSHCGDFHCGLRAFRKEAIDRINLRTTGMEFASEMVVKATLHGLRIAEVPTTLSPDGRSRPSHLRSWRDGWRHLRFMLLYCPRWLFLYPGVAIMLAGILVIAWLLPGPQRVGRFTLDVHTLLYAAAAVLVGFQAVLFSALGKIFAMTTGLAPETPKWQRLFRWITLEVGLLAGTVLFAAGLIGSFVAVGIWRDRSFGSLDPTYMLRLVVPSVVAMALGCQIILSSFFLSMLGLSRK